MEQMTYKSSGVNYEAMDPFKLACQKAAQETAYLLEAMGFNELSWTRGESAYLMNASGVKILAHVEEGLGTKNLIADAVGKLFGKSYYYQCAQDTVAMIVNDLITLGVMPVSVAMHLAVGSDEWFKDEKRSADLIRGWRDACIKSGCVWSGGETPTLKDVILPTASLLSGSAIGYAESYEHLLHPQKISDGDTIVFIESSGVHANGLTLTRKIADKLSDGYLTKLSNGRTFGETLLDPTHIYVPILRNHKGLANYAVNITGHGWRKLMRATETFEYVVDTLPRQQPIFDFIMENGPVSEREMYGNYNMGAGFALYVSPHNVDAVIARARRGGFTAFSAGIIHKSNKRRVIIEPKGILFEGDTLQVR